MRCNRARDFLAPGLVTACQAHVRAEPAEVDRDLPADS
jgi:hypothetical protein